MVKCLAQDDGANKGEGQDSNSSPGVKQYFPKLCFFVVFCSIILSTKHFLAREGEVPLTPFSWQACGYSMLRSSGTERWIDSETEPNYFSHPSQDTRS